MIRIINHNEDGIIVRDDGDHCGNAISVHVTAKGNPREWVSVDGSRVAVMYVPMVPGQNPPELWIEDGFTGGQDEVEFIDLTEVYRDGPLLDRIVAHLVAEENA